ncbi:putative transcription factor interactor and regulator Znf-B family [Helianthus annuus]|nr:putative transcription factor interactor and regulator Znf-B family [Helianthus annuus]
MRVSVILSPHTHLYRLLYSSVTNNSKMKINCDVCNKQEATVFCPADDAALCAACDHRVHHANTLAGKHPRFPLLPPSPKDSPLCDICQDQKALLFCQQDRAILCKDCDAAIHKVNEHTMNHCRFLLTGVKLSTVALSPTGGNGVVPDQNSMSRDQEPVTVKKPVAVSATAGYQTQKITTYVAPKSNGSGHGSTAASSISDYLIETLPGWHVENFLDSPTFYPKVDEDDQLAMFWDNELLKGSMNGCLSPETMGIWVPQAPPPAAPPPPQPLLLDPYQIQYMGFGSDQMVSGSSPFFAPINHNKITRSKRKKESDDGNCFTVPQISTPNLQEIKNNEIINSSWFLL